ncbi:GNAT family N-acetyltransferase [Vibrio vulnificus]|uniref:GNAT family N-acetyltransferase n=1 Tax=Vibrio vulnificus TaxID=672 RepID=UPI004058B5FD
MNFGGESGLRKLGLGGTHPLTQRYVLGGNMEIQKALKTDLDAVTRLVSEVSTKDVLPLLNEQGKQEYKDRVLPDLASTLDDEKFSSIKAVSGGEVLGFAALRGGNYLTHLFVANSQQGSGLGRTLLNHLLNKTDAREVSLRSSVNAVGFYNRNGFVATGEEAEFNGIRFVPMSLVRT